MKKTITRRMRDLDKPRDIRPLMVKLPADLADKVEKKLKQQGHSWTALVVASFIAYLEEK